jgi:M6 family metalloprotease-like protein
VDTLRVAIFRVDFVNDRLGGRTTGDGRFDLRTGVTDVLVDPPPHDKRYFEQHAEALRRYYDVQSYGSLALLPTVFPADPDGAYHLNDLADYGPWEVAQDVDIIAKAEAFVGDAIAAADLDPEVAFTQFDAFVVVHAGSDFQGDIDRNSEYDIPSFTLTLGDSLSVDGGAAAVRRVLVLPETASQDGRIAALNGVFAHEFGHVLGLPDLYNIFNGVPQVGYWSLMDSGENIPAIVYDPETDTEFLAEGIFPTSFDPWCKLQLFPGAVQLEVVGESFAGGLEAFVVNPRLPLVSLDGTETFLVENRALDLDGIEFPFVFQDSTTGVFLGPVDAPDTLGGPGGHYEYDAVLPGGGILIWHIDDKIIVPGLSTTGAVNYDTGFRGIAIEEADRIADQGVSNFGVPEDAFYTGNNDWFAPGEIPGSEANDGAYTGISIKVSGTPARTMGVEIRRPLARDGWPVFVLQTEETFTRPGPVVLADVSGDGRPEFLFTVDVTLIGQPQPRRGIVALRPDGQSVGGSGSSLVAEVGNRLLPGLAASERFVLTPGGPDTTVVAAVENGGKTYLWTAAGGSLDDTNLTENAAPLALSAPVLLPRGADPGWVLVAGSGSLHAFTVPGTLVYSDTALVPTPPVTPPTVNPGPAAGVVAAVGYSGGPVAFYPLDAGGAPPAVLDLAGEARHILAGVVSERGTHDFVIVTGDSAIVAAAAGDRVHSRWPLPSGTALSVSPALGDLDGDGKCELVTGAADGRVGVMNLDGSFALGWPRTVAGPVRNLAVVDLDGDGLRDVLALDGGDRFHGWNGRGRPLAGYPRVFGAWPRPLDPLTVVSAGMAGVDGDGTLTWMATTEEGILTAVRFPDARTRPGDWPVARGGNEGWNYQESPVVPLVEKPDLDGGAPLLVYPNPARGDGVEIRFLLETGETARIQILDLSGRPLTAARLDLRGGPKAGENAVRWDLANVAPGLYFCRLERTGGKESGVELAKIMVMR